MKEPKPFHIGTLVRNTYTDGLAKVEVALIRRGGVYIFIDDDEYEPYGYEANLWAHADDGSPLGEWVPLKPNWYQRGLMIYPASDQSDLLDGLTEKANAIIRGEVEQ